MSHSDVAAVVLAAGKGTRFRSDTAKVLHRAAGRSMLHHVLEALRPLGLAQVVVVIGHQAEEVEAAAEDVGLSGLTTAMQQRQLGTGHAAEAALDALDDGIGRVMVVPGDAPLLTAPVLEGLIDVAGDSAALLTTEPDDPTGYGRVVRGDHGGVVRIVEEADATPEERSVREVNAGVYAFPRSLLADALGRLDADNAQGELYLTDVVEILVADDRPVVTAPAPAEVVRGVNDRAQLAEAAGMLRRRHLDHLMTEVGVTVIDPAATYVDVDVAVERDAVLHPGCRLTGTTRIAHGAEIGPDADLADTTVAAGAVVRHAVCEGARIGRGAVVGPYTHLRPGTVLAADTKAGGFVEMKQATLGEGSKVPHLSYVGDATVGSGVNVSCGAVTVNYDGSVKHHTVIEDGAFIGCDTMLIAPVTVGRGAFTAAGSTITDDVPPDALAIARARQTVKPGWAAERRSSHDTATGE